MIRINFLKQLMLMPFAFFILVKNAYKKQGVREVVKQMSVLIKFKSNNQWRLITSAGPGTSKYR